MKKLYRAFFAALIFLSYTGAAFAQSTNFGFSPVGSTQTMAVTNSSSSITLNSSAGSTVVVKNTGSVTAFVKGGATALTTDFPILSGEEIVLNYPPGQVFSAITAAGATTLLVSKGLGNTTSTFTSGAVANGNAPPSATAITGNAAGTTGAVVGTLTATGTTTAYICGFNVSTIGGTAASSPITVAGLVGSSQVYQTPVNATAGQILVSQTFNPCIPASAVNTNITVTTTAAAGATAVDVNSWGFRQ